MRLSDACLVCVLSTVSTGFQSQHPIPHLPEEDSALRPYCLGKESSLFLVRH